MKIKMKYHVTTLVPAWCGRVFMGAHHSTFTTIRPDPGGLCSIFVKQIYSRHAASASKVRPTRHM